MFSFILLVSAFIFMVCRFPSHLTGVALCPLNVSHPFMNIFITYYFVVVFLYQKTLK